MSCNVWDEITNPFLNFNGWADRVSLFRFPYSSASDIERMEAYTRNKNKYHEWKSNLYRNWKISAWFLTQGGIRICIVIF